MGVGQGALIIRRTVCICNLRGRGWRIFRVGYSGSNRLVFSGFGIFSTNITPLRLVFWPWAGNEISGTCIIFSLFSKIPTTFRSKRINATRRFYNLLDLAGRSRVSQK